MAQVTLVLTFNDNNIAQDLADAQLIQPKLQGENNTDYVKRICFDYCKGLVKEGRIRRLQSAAGKTSGDPDITMS